MTIVACRTRAQSDEAVVLDMGLWQKQQVPPTTPTSPAPASAAAAAAALRTSLPGAMPQQQLLGASPDQPPHYSLPISPSSSANGGYGGCSRSSQDGGGGYGGWGGGWAAGGGWGFWGSGATSTAGGAAGFYGGGGAQSCATAGSGSEHGSTRLRLYQVRMLQTLLKALLLQTHKPSRQRAQ